MIATALIQAVKLESTVVTRLLFWFGLLTLVKAYLPLNLIKLITKKIKIAIFVLKIYYITLIQCFYR